MNAVSPLAPAPPAQLSSVPGVRFATASAGVKYQGRDDVLLVELAAETQIAGVFTRSATRSAPVLDCQTKLGSGEAGRAAILVNSGNANAFTGRHGTGAVSTLTHAVSNLLDVSEQRVFTASTGVIGERLPHDRIVDCLSGLKSGLREDALLSAAKAIMTTDTYPKVATQTIEIRGQPVKIAGIAKGSGMIAPDMATMLSFVFTDAAVEPSFLQGILERLCRSTFNAITVDSDTSTSDTLLLAATGAAGIDATDNTTFETALGDVLHDLAIQVVRDGEGATKLIQIDVIGAADAADAKKAAMAIANSPLVKTAIAGEDPNWGRIVMAVGKSGAAADRDRLGIRFGDIEVARQGWVSPDYSEADGATYMKRQEIQIEVDLGIGAASFTAWTCDLTHGYISINADYRS